jgi:prophage regulatory protein
MQMMRRSSVEIMTALSRSTIYAMMARGEFPQPIKLGVKAVAWRESDITAWLSSRELRAPSKVQQ